MKNETGKDTRLLEALDFIDSDLIGETADRLMKPTAVKKRFFTTRKLALIAACLCLAVLLVPVILTLTGGEVSIKIFNNDPPEPPYAVGEVSTETSSNIYDGSRGLVYRVSDDGTYAILVDIGSCTDRDITVASTYNGLPVTETKSHALYRCEEVESLTIPDTMEIIYVRAFADCPNLKRVYIGAGVRTIYMEAFTENDLDEVVISPDNPYLVCRNSCIIELETQTIVFGYKGAVIPDDGSVERIAARAFSMTKGITSMVIPEGIKEIGVGAFEGCEFKSITLPKSLEKLGSNVFSSCKRLEYFDLGGYHELPDGTLAHCDAVREVVGLENVTRIGNHSLWGDTLRSIKLTSALKYIDKWALSGAESLGRIYFDGTVAEWNAIPKGYQWNRLLPATNVFCNDGMGDPRATLTEEES